MSNNEVESYHPDCLVTMASFRVKRDYQEFVIIITRNNVHQPWSADVYITDNLAVFPGSRIVVAGFSLHCVGDLPAQTELETALNVAIKFLNNKS